MPAGSLKTYTLNFLKKTNEIYRDKFLIDVSNTLKNDLADDRGDITRNLFSPSHKIIVLRFSITVRITAPLGKIAECKSTEQVCCSVARALGPDIDIITQLSD